MFVHSKNASSVSNRKSSFRCVVVYDHLVPAQALPIDTIPSLKRLQQLSPSSFSITSSATSYDVVNLRASKRPVSTDRETAHISRIITNAKVIIMASWEFGEMSSVAVSMDVFSPFSRLRRSVKWLYYDCNRLTKSLASTGSQVAISKKMKGRFPRERTRFSTMMGGRPLFSI